MLFRSSPEMGGGGIACLGPTTIIGRTIYISESSSGATLDDPWVFAGPIKYIDSFIPGRVFADTIS